MNHRVVDVPDGLSPLAAGFLRAHAQRLERLPVERHRARWLELGVTAEAVDRAAEFEARWGGLALPPAPWYEGGPRVLRVDVPWGSAAEGWWLPAGDQRSSVPFGFAIGPDGEFGIIGPPPQARWTPLHTGIEGWVESVALAHHAAQWATRITRLAGEAVEGIDLDALEPVTATAGLADTWWRGPDSLVAVYRGEADCFDRPAFLRAHRYDGLPAHALRTAGAPAPPAP